MNDPGFCDLAQVSGIEMDGKNFDEILPLIEEARKRGQWLVFAVTKWVIQAFKLPSQNA
jgi:hypothetical protein